MNWHRYCVAGALGLALSGCAGAPPIQRRADTATDIRVAEELGARRYPQAALHLKLARDGLANAERLIADRDHREAELRLMQAESDAELAIALVKEAEMQSEARRALADIRALQDQLNMERPDEGQRGGE